MILILQEEGSEDEKGGDDEQDEMDIGWRGSLPLLPRCRLYWTVFASGFPRCFRGWFEVVRQPVRAVVVSSVSVRLPSFRCLALDCYALVFYPVRSYTLPFVNSLFDDVVIVSRYPPQLKVANGSSVELRSVTICSYLSSSARNPVLPFRF